MSFSDWAVVLFLGRRASEGGHTNTNANDTHIINNNNNDNNNNANSNTTNNNDNDINNTTNNNDDRVWHRNMGVPRKRSLRPVVRCPIKQT